MKEELDGIDLRDLGSLVDSYARLTGSVVGFRDEKSGDVVLKHDKARERILDKIIKLLG